MKWKLLTVAVLLVMTGGVSVLLLANDVDPFGSSAPKQAAAVDPAFGEPSDFRDVIARKSESVKDRFIRLASEYARDGDEAELKRMADDLQKKINERDAGHKVLEVQSLLQQVLETYPETEAGRRAKSMLDASIPAAQEKPEESPPRDDLK